MFTLLGIMMFATTLLGQSFYQTYNQRSPAVPYRVVPSGSAIKIYSSNDLNIRTNAAGNLISNTNQNLGAFEGRDVDFRARNGQYVFLDENDGAGRLQVRLVSTTGNLQRTVNLGYNPGHIGDGGAIAEYSNGDLLITYSHGPSWTDPFVIAPKTFRWARINPSNGAIVQQGNFAQSINNLRVFRADEATIAPNGDIYLALLEETTARQTHFLIKINANGSFAWRKQVATLERGIKSLTATNNHAAYNHTQVLEGVRIANASNGDLSGNVLVEPIFMQGLPPELLVATPDGNIMVIVQTGNPRNKTANEIWTLKLSPTGTVLAQNKITQTFDGSYKEPIDAFFNSAGELIIAGSTDPTPSSNFFDVYPFLLKLGANGQWVQGGSSGGVDLELSSTSSNPNPNVWETTNMTVTLRNTGSANATNVNVKVDIPSAIILQGGNEYQASQGTFAPYGNSQWNVGTVAAGSTKTLTLNFYNPNTNAKSVFAQVQSANRGDSDSAPGNGSCCSGLEDDETFIEFNGSSGGTQRFPDLRGNDVRLASNTAPAGGVLNFTFDLINSGEVAVNGDYLIQMRIDDNQLTGSFGTRVGVINTGNTGLGTTQNIPGAITIPANTAPGTYYLWISLDDNLQVRETNESNNRFRSVAFTITDGGGGNPPGGSGAIDLSMSASSSNPNQWAFFSSTITARNTGNSTANNVRVKINRPAAITYRGGNEFNASKGSLDWWATETWNIGSLNAGQSVTLTVNFFRLSANGFTLSTNVTSGGGNDSASINFGSAANGVNNRSAVVNNMQNEPFAIVNAYPNPTTEHITVAVYSNKTQTSDLDIFSLSGKRIFGNSYELEEGLNEIKIETAQFPSGQYFIKMDPFHPYLRKIDFTKMR